MVLQAGDIADLITTTQDELGEMKFEDLASSLEWYMCETFMRKENTRIQSGPNAKFNAIVNHNSQAKMTGIGATDDVNVIDAHITGTVPWRHATTNYAIDEREISMNTGARQIVDLVKSRRVQAMIALAELMETQLWSAPAVDGDTSAFGIPYWVVSNATDGFNGGDDANHTQTGGIDSDTYANWKNYTFTYSTISTASLVRKMRTAQYRTNWRPPVSVPGYERHGKRHCFVFTDTDTIVQLEELLEGQNENLGMDVASMGGKTAELTRSSEGMVFFRGNPVVQVPKLRSSSLSQPLYGLDLNKFGTMILSNWLMKEKGPFRSSNQHTMLETHVDTSFNWCCTNRRSQWVGYQA